MFSIDFPSVQESISLILNQSESLQFEFSSAESSEIYEILTLKNPKNLFIQTKTIKAVFDAKRIDLVPRLYDHLLEECLLQEIIDTKDCSILIHDLDPLVKITTGNSMLIPKALLKIITTGFSISFLNEYLPTAVLWQDLIRGDLVLNGNQDSKLFYESCLQYAVNAGITDEIMVQVSTLSALVTGKMVEHANLLKSIIDGPFTNNFDLHLTCVEAIGIIALHDPIQRQKLSTWFEEFLLDPSLLFANYKHEYSVILKECGAHILSLILDKSSRETQDSSIRKSFLFSCINTMHASYQLLLRKDTDPANFPQLRKKFENSISSISHLSRVLKPKETVEIAIPALVRRLEECSTEDKELIWHALGNIGMTFDLEIFKGILAFTLSSLDSVGKISKIAHSLARMPGRPQGLLVVYVEKLLDLFLERAAIMHKNGDTSPESLGQLKDLTNLIRILLESEGLQEYLSNSDLMRPLRNMWFYLVLFVLTPTGWPKDWYPILKVVARNSPPLILEKNVRNLDVNLGSDSILLATFPDPITNKIKPILMGYVPSKSTEIKVLSWPVSVYLVTVYQMELLRMKNVSLLHLFGYLVDDRLQRPTIYPVLESLADAILTQALKDTLYKKLANNVIQEHLETLLLFSAHRVSFIRSFVSKWIIKILNVVPQMLFYKPSVVFMLDILRFLDNEKRGHVEHHVDFRTTINFISKEEVNESSVDYYKLCQDWITSALSISSKAIIPIIQAYIGDIYSVSPWMGGRESDDLYSLTRLFQKFYADQGTSAHMIKSSSRQEGHLGEIRGIIETGIAAGTFESSRSASNALSKQFSKEIKKLYRDSSSPHFCSNLFQIISKSAALIILNDQIETELIMLICHAPKVLFSAMVVEMTMETLSWIMTSKPMLVNRVLSHLTSTWEAVAIQKLGIYSTDVAYNPFVGPMTYGNPPPMPLKDFNCQAHLIWIKFYLDRFNYDRLQGDGDCLSIYSSFIRLGCQKNYVMCRHFKAFEAQLELATLAVQVAKQLTKHKHKAELFVWTDVLRICTDIFTAPPTFGDINQECLKKMLKFYHIIKKLKFEKISSRLYNPLLKSAFVSYRGDERVEFSDVQQLLLLLLESEINRICVWLKPLDESGSRSERSDIPPLVAEKSVKWPFIVKTAWRINPRVAIALHSRFLNSSEPIEIEIADLARFSFVKAIQCPSALSIFLSKNTKESFEPQLRHLLYWDPVPPIAAIQILAQPLKLQSWLIQYAIRSLEVFPIQQVFFYIPQLVQALRYDSRGYIERYILEAAKSSQYFAHQIIWNMEANMYKDDAKEVPDALKPDLDRVIAKIIKSLTGGDKEFFEREFAFFKEVTDISGKLKPLVESGASKADKKKKIDEEMLKIKVDIGVYLPTNPGRTVLELDYKSGRPLQSHAKAPFMATFKVENSIGQSAWMSSIFKVGDDCRQDVLCLQLISVFQSIFQSVGLDLYTFPYRVVATAPGCGVIEVIPQSISRDQMGREKVNSLYDWFLAQFGEETSIRYKTARMEFVKSLAAYSIIMFLLQIKDRHNGNIMFDKEGHLIHIDFGFMLSIAPGGGILEVSPFKLTAEMIAVMGGDANCPAYILFSELCIKGYLASRLYAEEIVSIVQLMADSGLPCFKGEVTIRKLRERFQLDKSDRAAADFMISCIRQSDQNTRAGLYDLFQYAQNGIPYQR